MISIPLTQLRMKCAEPCSGHCTHANHFVISLTTPCGLPNCSAFIRTPAKILLLPRGRWGSQGSPILLLCHRGAGHGGAKANQGLIKGLQKTSRFSDEAAQGEHSPFLEKKRLHDPPVHHLEVFPGKPSTRKSQTALNVTKILCHSSPVAAVPGVCLQSIHCFMQNNLCPKHTAAVGPQEHSPCISQAWLHWRHHLGFST